MHCDRSTQGAPRWWLVLGLLFATTTGGSAAAENPDDSGIIRPRQSLPAPDFRLETRDGRPLALDDFKGRLLILSFWASWCESCRREFPSLSELWHRYRDRGLAVVAISIDREPKAAWRAGIRFGADFPLAVDAGRRVAHRYEVQGVPTTYLIGVDGRFLGLAIGERDWTAPGIEQVITNWLPERTSAPKDQRASAGTRPSDRKASLNPRPSGE